MPKGGVRNEYRQKIKAAKPEDRPSEGMVTALAGKSAIKVWEPTEKNDAQENRDVNYDARFGSQN